MKKSFSTTKNKVAPITQELVTKCEKLRRELGSFQKGIEDRLDYIIRTVYQAFGYQIQYWWYEDAEEGELGSLWRAFSQFQIEGISVGAEVTKEMVILLKDGSEYELTYSVPTRWLFEDFEDELLQGKKAYEEKLEQERVTNKKKQHAKKEKKKQALAKLTKEERQVLGLE